MLISLEGTGKNKLFASQERMADSPVLSDCSLLRNPLPKPTGVLEHCPERETSCWLFIFGAFPSDHIPKATNDVNEHFFIHSSNSCKLDLRIPVSYISEFRELTVATT